MKQFLSKHKTLFLLFMTGIIIFLGVYIYQILNYTYITVQFDNLRPFREKLEVFYNGFEIGHTIKVMPDKDYKTTLVKIALHPQDLKLPYNITIKLKREKHHDRKIDFLELIYPEKPSEYLLKNGDIIAGKATVDIESYFASQEPESLDQLKDNLNETIENLQTATNELSQLISTVQATLNENRTNIKTTTSNIARTSQNIENMTNKFNRSLSSQKLDNTTSSIDITSQNVEELSKNINTLSSSLNQTMPKVDCTINQTNSILKNLNEITCGISKTLQKRMGGLRLLFGKTINDECTNDCR